MEEVDFCSILARVQRYIDWDLSLSLRRHCSNIEEHKAGKWCTLAVGSRSRNELVSTVLLQTKSLFSWKSFIRGASIPSCLRLIHTLKDNLLLKRRGLVAHLFTL